MANTDWTKDEYNDIDTEYIKTIVPRVYSGRSLYKMQKDRHNKAAWPKEEAHKSEITAIEVKKTHKRGYSGRSRNLIINNRSQQVSMANAVWSNNNPKPDGSPEMISDNQDDKQQGTNKPISLEKTSDATTTNSICKKQKRASFTGVALLDTIVPENIIVEETKKHKRGYSGRSCDLIMNNRSQQVTMANAVWSNNNPKSSDESEVIVDNQDDEKREDKTKTRSLEKTSDATTTDDVCKRQKRASFSDVALLGTIIPENIKVEEKKKHKRGYSGRSCNLVMNNHSQKVTMANSVWSYNHHHKPMSMNEAEATVKNKG